MGSGRVEPMLGRGGGKKKGGKKKEKKRKEALLRIEPGSTDTKV